MWTREREMPCDGVPCPGDGKECHAVRVTLPTARYFEYRYENGTANVRTH